MKILVVEDDTRVAGLIKRGLEEQGYDITLAYDGISGKKLAFNNKYDLIITDIILPKLDGIELCREIRTKDPWMPVIMLTAMGTTDDKVEGFDAGADDYLVKPFVMRELLARINALMKRSTGKAFTGSILKYANLEMNLRTKSVKRSDPAKPGEAAESCFTPALFAPPAIKFKRPARRMFSQFRDCSSGNPSQESLTAAIL